MTDLVKGEQVRLKSGGPRMSIDDIGNYSPMGIGGEPPKAKCSWFDTKGNRKTELFELHTLERVGPAVGNITLTRG